MIPKVIHRIWLEDPMPPAFRRFGEQWQTLHPEWHVIDWTDPADLPTLHNQGLYDEAESIYPDDWKRFQADLVRLELLHRYGGVYVDTDVEPLKPIDPLAGLACFAGRSPQHIGGHHPITNAVIGSQPNNAWIAMCVLTIPQAVNRYRHRPLAQSVGPWHLTRVYEDGDWPTVTILDDLYTQGWFTHHWNNARRKRGAGLG